jgi:hypothetical protein
VAHHEYRARHREGWLWLHDRRTDLKFTQALVQSCSRESQLKLPKCSQYWERDIAEAVGVDDLLSRASTGIPKNTTVIDRTWEQLVAQQRPSRSNSKCLRGRHVLTK